MSENGLFFLFKRLRFSLNVKKISTTFKRHTVVLNIGMEQYRVSLSVRDNNFERFRTWTNHQTWWMVTWTRAAQLISESFTRLVMSLWLPKHFATLTSIIGPHTMMSITCTDSPNQLPPTTHWRQRGLKRDPSSFRDLRSRVVDSTQDTGQVTCGHHGQILRIPSPESSSSPSMESRW